MRKRYGKSKTAWIAEIPFGISVLFLVLGLVIGNVFAIGIWQDRKPITKSEAIAVTATFDSYRSYYSRYGSLSEVEISFWDHPTRYLDGAAVTPTVEAVLGKLSPGSRLSLLLHPDSNMILAITYGGDTVLDFDEAIAAILGESIVFTVTVGVFGYLCALLGFISLLVRFRIYKKRRRFSKSSA